MGGKASEAGRPFKFQKDFERFLLSFLWVFAQSALGQTEFSFPLSLQFLEEEEEETDTSFPEKEV